MNFSWRKVCGKEALPVCPPEHRKIYGKAAGWALDRLSFYRILLNLSHTETEMPGTTVAPSNPATGVARRYGEP